MSYGEGCAPVCEQVLRELRLKHRKSLRYSVFPRQADLIAASRLGSGSVSDWEQGREVGAEVAEKLAKALGTSVENVIGPAAKAE